MDAFKTTRPSYASDQALRTFIQRAFEEDIQEGDHSSLSTIPADLKQRARLLVKQEGILAGVELAKFIFNEMDPTLELEIKIQDGTPVQKGDEAFYVTGSARAILQAERLVLNCMQRMSGIATLTASWLKELEGTQTRLLDTRKTTPNFRICEKWAVRIGGGENHRFGLFDMIMLKDNHIDYNGSITQAVSMAKDYLQMKGLDLKIEVETRTLEEVREAAALDGVYRIMLDNMDLQTMQQAVEIIGGRAQTEASGGITKDQLKPIAATGVDFISAGALTHSAENMDLSLKAVLL